MYLAFDIGGTFVKYGVVDPDGQILEKGKSATPDTQEPFLTALSKTCQDLQTRFSLDGIGISAPGTPNRQGTMVSFGALTKMTGLPLKAELEKLTGLPVAVENDANAAAIAEQWLGAGQAYHDYMVMALGTGIGGGIVINNQVYRGAHGTAGEFGWVMNNGLSRVGELEEVSQNYRSSVGTGLLPRYNQALQSVSHGQAQPLDDAKVLLDLVQASDETASVIFDEFLDDLVVNLMNLVACYDPEAILIGGGISANTYFLDRLNDRWHKLISRHNGLHQLQKQGLLTEIKPAGLRNDAGMLGAAYIIKQSLGK